MKYSGLLVLLALAACRPPVERLDYDRDKEQILFLYNPERLQQVFYRKAAEDAKWTSTSSASVEQEPPDSGPWALEFPDWVVVHARNSELQADRLRCSAHETSLALRAKSFAIEPCGAEEQQCCSSAGMLFVGRGGKCRVRTGWTDEPGLCVSRAL